MRGIDALAGRTSQRRGVLREQQIDNYWRVREARTATHATALTSETRTRAFRGCLCGAKLAIVVDLEARPRGEVEDLVLLGWRFLEIRHSTFVEQIDFAFDPKGKRSRLAPEEREQVLRLEMEKRAAELAFPPDGLIRVAGPTRCEDCGDVRERAHGTQFWSGRGFFRSDAPSEQLFLGSRIAFDDDWLATDTARPPFFRTRHPVGGEELAIVHRSRNWGCRCGAGRASFVTRFARREDELELIEISIRAIHSRAGLRDVDFVYMPPEAERCEVRSMLFDEFERLESQLF